MKKSVLVGCIAILSVVIVVSGQTAQTARPQQSSTPTQAAGSAPRAVLDQYCISCHSDKAKIGGLSLEKLDVAHVGENPQLWEKVVRKLRAGVMPPPGIKRPDPASADALASWLENEIDRTAGSKVEPGTVGVHRLNRTEYQNAIRDLLSVDVDAASLLPADDSSDGFDNIAGSLSISPTLLAAYVSAAGKISRLAVGHWTTPTEATYIPPTDTSQDYHIEGLPFGTRGGMLIRHTFPADGEYVINVQSLNAGTFVPGEQLEISIDGARVKLFDWDAQTIASNRNGRPEQYMEVRIPVKGGTRNIGITFLATNYRPSLDEYQRYKRSSLDNYSVDGFTIYPQVGYVQVRGPFNPTGATDLASLKKVFVCRPATAKDEEPCAKQIVSSLASRAYRRPSNPEDLESLMSFYEQGRKTGTFEDGVEMALRRILASPQFVLRVEAEPANLKVGQTYRISDLELASRLSFFLWSSQPDDQLVTLASQNKLRDPKVLEAQVKRMLADPRAEAITKNFAGQWLLLRNLPGMAPIQTKFPDWDDTLRQAFRTETEMFFDSIIREDRNVTDLLTADYTFVNERLAQHYGIKNIYGPQFRRVTLGPDMDARRGLLGKGAVLTVTARPDRNSPVKRGVWILENILDSHAPDPPPNVPPLENTTAEEGKVMSLRDQMQEHRKNEPCASCHKLMDPMGFALQNFDADGKWRTKDGGDGGVPIDASGVMFDGTKLDSPTSLRQALLHYSPAFVRSVTEKMMTYGLGRGVDYTDMPVVRSIVRDAARNNYKFSSIVLGIVKSAPFQMRTKVQETSVR